MNALIHSFDRIEPPPQRSRLPRFLRATWDRISAALRESRDRQALAHLSEWSEHNLLPYANFHDPGGSWWQWEPGGEFLGTSTILDAKEFDNVTRHIHASGCIKPRRDPKCHFARSERARSGKG